MAVKTVYARVVIGEVNWAGSSLSTADEWIELWNTGLETVSIAGWRIAQAGDADIVFSQEASLPPSGIWLIANFAASDTRSALSYVPDIVTTTISLINDQLDFSLFNANDELIDRAGNGKTPPKGASTPIKTSMVRSDIDQNGADSLAWESATATMGLDPMVNAFGTPGFCDGCTPFPLLLLPPESVQEPPSASVSNSSTLILSESTSTSVLLDPSSIAVSSSSITPSSITTSTTPAYEPVPIEQANAAASTTEHLLSLSTSSTEPSTYSMVSTTISTIQIAVSSTDSVVTSTTTTNTVTQSAETTSTTVAHTSSTTTELSLPLFTVSLQDILPNPTDGHEQIQLTIKNATSVSVLDQWILSDAQNTIFRFLSDADVVTSTNGLDLLVNVFLNGSHLNNDGDTVILKDAQDRLWDTTTYPKLQKNEHWIRANNGAGWQKSGYTEPTTVAATIQTTQSSATPPPSAILTPAVFHTTTLSTRTPPPSTMIFVRNTSTNDLQPPLISIIKEKTRKQEKPTTATSTVLEKTSTQKKIKTTKEKKEKLKTSKTKKTSLTPMVSTKDISSLYALMSSETRSSLPVRVRLTGTVGSVPKLLNASQFVLQNPDGRGLLVQGNMKTQTPPFGATVEITGTLILNDQGLHLSMNQKDGWRVLRLNDVIQSRVIDLVFPSQEDAWSLVQVTGTVVNVKNSRVQLDADDTTLTVQIKPATGYRAARIRPGDQLSVRGIIDLRGSESILLPRKPEDILIFSQPAAQKNRSVPSPLPSWSPFAAAGITVALGQGYKRLRKKYEQRRLEKMLARAKERLEP